MSNPRLPEERTLALIKPNGVQRRLVGVFIQRFEQKNLRLVAIKYIWPSEKHIRQHYSDLAGEPYFPGMIKNMCSGPVVSMVWEGVNAIRSVRAMIGAPSLRTAQWEEPAPGTIRGDFCLQAGHGTVIHASDSIEAASREIALWFKEDELVSSTSATL